MSLAAYQPWSKVEDIDVSVTKLYAADGTPINRIRVPLVYACDAEAVLPTAIVTVFAVLKAVRPQLFENEEDADA